MIGIVCAMHSELASLRNSLELEQMDVLGPWHIYKARQYDLLAMVSGVGKVNAAAGLAFLLSQFPIKSVIGIGVAGAIAEDLKIGDVVVCSGAIQHDMDASAFGYEVGMVPVLGKKLFSAEKDLVQGALLAGVSTGLEVTVRAGLVLSGDKFVAGAEGIRLRESFRGDCVDMETAAWAQVAEMFKVPWVALRSISDQADGAAPADFNAFLNLSVANMSAVIFKLLEDIAQRNIALQVTS